MSISCFGQKRYSFDYLVEYEFTSYKDSTSNEPVYYMTNSEDNSYFVKLKNVDSLSFELEFVDQDQIWSTTELKKENFFRAESIILDCSYDIGYKNNFKFRVKEYKFDRLTDTLMNDLKLKKYKLTYTGKRKKKKSFPIGTNLYIVEDSTNFHLPILTHSTAFEEWKQERNIPNGIFKEKIFYDFENEMEYKFILKGYYPIDKKIIIPENCLE